MKILLTICCSALILFISCQGSLQMRYWQQRKSSDPDVREKAIEWLCLNDGFEGKTKREIDEILGPPGTVHKKNRAGRITCEYGFRGKDRSFILLVDYRNGKAESFGLEHVVVNLKPDPTER
ncbi:MAG: hypothetical protein ACYS8W_06830 [Planctomycetota bacterium]|jgi:hypothetical protein